jgi:IclR family transcriptional regulator, KDG regulon repressor
MDEIQSLARGLQIVDKVVQAGRGVGNTEIAGALDIDKSSASRMVKTLVSYGYLQPEPGTRRYVTGKRLLQIGWQMMNMLPLRQTARPYLEWLVKVTSECSHTAVYAEGKALVIDDVETANTLRVAGQTGRMIPLHCTAVGKVLLAFSDIPTPQTLSHHTTRTITDPDQLQTHLTQIRQNGYALDDEEYDEGIRCIAAPVYSYLGLAIATIGISGPAVRMTETCIREFSETVKQAASELSAAMGYKPEGQDGEDL